MQKIDFYMAGQIGIVKDMAPDELPPLAWSDGRNIIFQDGKIIRRNGFENVLNTPVVEPNWVRFAFTGVNAFWMYGNSTGSGAASSRIYATDGATHTNITRISGGDYSVLHSRLWSGGILGGIPVITNGIDVPQMWNPVGLSQPLANLSNWPATERCRIIKPYKQFLVALAITKGANFFPHMVHWSSPAAPGAVPTSWDVGDPTTLSGEFELLDEWPGEIRDGLALRDIMVVYKDNTVHGIQYIGGQSVFRNYSILAGSGILSTHCVCYVREGRAHFIATGDDIVVFDGQNTESILDERWKAFIENNLDQENSDKSLCFSIPRLKEAWFCFPEVGNAWPTLALVWNWQENTITARTLPAGFRFAALGALSAVGDAWDDDDATWDSDTTFWDATQFRASFLEVVSGNGGPNRFVAFDRGQMNEEAEYSAYVERTGLSVVGQDRISGQFKNDPTIRKLTSRIWMKATGAPFQVQLGGQETADDPVEYLPPQTFTPGTDKYLDFEYNTPLIAVKFFSDVAGQWTINNYSLEFELVGNL